MGWGGVKSSGGPQAPGQLGGLRRQDSGLPCVGWRGQDLQLCKRRRQNPPAQLCTALSWCQPLAAQIFNLMKFDSYARFVKSPLYQECLLAEAEGRPLREPGSSRLGSPDTSRKVRTGRQEAGRGLRTSQEGSGLGPRHALENSCALRSRS